LKKNGLSRQVKIILGKIRNRLTLKEKFSKNRNRKIILADFAEKLADERRIRDGLKLISAKICISICKICEKYSRKSETLVINLQKINVRP
jgi:hypothetical protein